MSRAAAAAGAMTAFSPLQAADVTPYSQNDALGLAELVKRGDVTPVELLEEAISRVERLNPERNAVVTKMMG
jgi:amidase